MTRCPRCHQRLPANEICPQHGPPTRSSETVLPARPFGEIAGLTHGDCIAAGGSAFVFAADPDPAGHARVVKWARWSDGDARRRFAREAAMTRAAGAVAPAVLGEGDGEGRPYLVLERLTGATVAARLRTRDELDPRLLLEAVARAAAAIHARGLVHGDLKPENLVLDSDALRVIDFGLACRRGSHTEEQPGGATIYYAAPEQIARAALSPATDVYALGVIAFELFAGRPPFVGDRSALEYAHQLCRAPRLNDVTVVPAELDRAVAASLAKDPLHRPSARELADLLASLPRWTGLARTTATPRERRTERGPAILVWIAGGDFAGTTRIVGETLGRIVRSSPRGVLAAYLWRDHDAPRQAALAAARRLTALDAAVTLHGANVLVRIGAGRPAIHGESLDHPEQWLPPVPWSGIVATRAVADELDDEVSDDDTLPGFRRILDLDRSKPDTPTTPDLVARGGLVSEIVGVLGEALANERPQLVTLVGDSRMGKSRTLDVVRAWLAHAMRVIALGARVSHGSAGLRPALEAALANEPGLTLLDRLRAAAMGGLALVIDDAHHVEDEVLDAIETAASWSRGRLVVVIASARTLLDGRPAWGERATAHAIFTLRPLPDDAAASLTRRLLAPARRIPDALVELVVSRAAGNPGTIVGLTRELHRRGLVRRHPDSDEWYVAADEIGPLPADAGERWLAAQELSRLPAGLATFLQLAAALGADFTIPEIEAIQACVARIDAPIDAQAGLEWLSRRHLVIATGERFVIAQASARAAFYDQLDPTLRDEIHRAAYDYWRRRPESDGNERLARLAHHGRACGDAQGSATAYLALARDGNRRRAHVEAERMATLAIDTIGETSPRLRATALLERARARRPLTLYEAARADLRDARALVDASADRTLAIELLVADGAVCDFIDRLAESAAAIEAAAELARAGVPEETTARLTNWLGVVRARQDRLDEAAELLWTAVALGETLDDHETMVGSMLMLGGVLRRLGRIDEGRAILDRAIERCRQARDVFHLTVGHFNRINVWRALGDRQRAEADCEEAIAIAERHGYGQLEIWGRHNLATLHFTAGAWDQALGAARGAYEQARRRFRGQPPMVATLQLAAFEAGHGAGARAAEILAEIDPRDAAASPSTASVYEATRLLLGGGTEEAWRALVERTGPPSEGDDGALVAWLRAQAAARNCTPVSAPSTPACACGGTR